MAIVALESAGFVVANTDTLITVGDLTKPAPILAGIGFVIIVALDYRKVPGAIIVGILLLTAASIVLGLVGFQGVFALPPSPEPTLLQLDIVGGLELGLITIIFIFLLLDMFDSTGTLIGVAQRAGFVDKKGHLPRLKKALVVDSGSTMVGALLGTSTTTAYVESAAGVRAGGRTGLTAVVVGILFLLALFFAPLAGTVPAYATAPAVMFVACVMAQSLSQLDWDDVSDYAPAVVTAIGIPLTYSISTGIGLGFIAYAAVKLISGRFGEVHPAMIVLAALFVLKFSVS